MADSVYGPETFDEFKEEKKVQQQQQKSESFLGVVNDIKNTVCKHGVYTPYIKFTVLNSAYSNGSDGFSFTTNDSDNCMITSFENVKNGSGQANSFSLVISFSPSKSLFYKTNNVDYSDISLIDKVFNLNLESTTTVTENGETTGNTLRKCKIQYGYGYPKPILTKEYEGVILDYTTEISNGILNYTVTGYSGLAVECKDIIITIEGSNSEGDEKEAETKKPTAIVKEVFEKYIKPNSSYTLEFAEDTEGTDQEIEIPPAQNVTVFQYIKTVLESAVYSEDTEETPAEERSMYTYTVSDISKTILIERYDPKAKQNKANDVIRFSWMGPTGEDIDFDYASNAMVIDFKTNFKGSVSMAYDYSKYTKLIRSGINSAGETVNASGTSIPTAGSNTKNDSSVNLNLWANRLQYCYTATLVTLGIPCEMKILDNIYIAPMILGQEHISGGLYKITKITDVIDGSGFTTTFELARNQAPDLKKQYEEALEEFNSMSVNSPWDVKYKEEKGKEVNQYKSLLVDSEGVD